MWDTTVLFVTPPPRLTGLWLLTDPSENLSNFPKQLLRRGRDRGEYWEYEEATRSLALGEDVYVDERRRDEERRRA